MYGHDRPHRRRMENLDEKGLMPEEHVQAIGEQIQAVAKSFNQPQQITYLLPMRWAADYHGDQLSCCT